MRRDHSGGGGPIINYSCMLLVEDQTFAMGHGAMDLDVLSQIYLCQPAELPWAFVLGGCDEHEQFLHTFQVFPTPNLMEVGSWK